jgi:hypothetical protein
VGQSIPGGWSVVELSPRLLLEQRWTDSLLRRAVVPLGPLVVGLFLIGVTRESDWGVRLAVVPVAVLFFLVSFLGVLNLARSVRRRHQGVRLLIEPTQVTGYPEARSMLGDYFVALGQHPRAEVKGATLTVFRDPKRGTARAKIHLELEGGRGLIGPEASGEDVQWPAVRDALLPAAAAIARALGVKLTLEYPWCEQRVEVSW